MNQLDYYQEFHFYYKKNISLEEVIKNIKEHKQIIFVKYGDGEVECMKVSDNIQENYGANCDNDVYFPELSLELKEAFLYFVNHNYKNQVYIGKWHYKPEIDYLSSYSYINKNSNKVIPFIDYHLIMNDKKGLSNHSMYQFVKTIKEDNDIIKIVISNIDNLLLKDLFSSQFFVETPKSSLYLKIDEITNQMIEIINNNQNDNKRVILLTSCGLSAKVLIYRLYKKYGKLISAFDLGSSFDLLCKKRVTRTYQNEYSYETIYHYYQDLLD